jgi:hypothetical protein
VTESNLYSLFKISLENFFNTKFHIYNKLHIQPSELENMDFYEFHYLVKDLVDLMKKEAEANKGQSEQQQGMMSKMKTPNIKLPSMKIPKM